MGDRRRPANQLKTLPKSFVPPMAEISGWQEQNTKRIVARVKRCQEAVSARLSV